jgi:hypothetical protein
VVYKKIKSKLWNGSHNHQTSILIKVKLNPIKNLWAKMERGMTGHKPRNLEELWQSISSVWEDFTEKELKTLVMSVPVRCREVLKQNGAATKY